ncbi:hypothetical protein LC048_08460 [Mesobacillus subterraneus]|uniref:hypothetical protein n=1 Tax=Mesobacillus subterraneus TaxID=285983 RepID=UPI001CFD58E0|nr:hypothetical protein [Mesobacillus subterraneus]WLR56883.1 hypothetical protein LC048_08460 [Mesobacillus subterraneus]
MNKSVLAIILATGLFFAGCTNDLANDIEQDQNTIEHAMLESGIDTDNIIYTEKIQTEDAFSIYQITNGYGILQYVNTNKGWQYRGASGFEQASSGKLEPVTFGTATWLMGDYSSKGNNTYKTVFIGEIHEADIAKVILEVNQGKYHAKILTSDNRKFWFHLLNVEDSPSDITKISGYSSDGKLVYENYLNLPE